MSAPAPALPPEPGPQSAAAKEARCRRCTLPERFPRVRFNADGICQHCEAAGDPAAIAQERKALAAQLDAVLAKARGADAYDVVVAYSGGKDSTYVLGMMAERFNGRALAVTIDNGFLSPSAKGNIDRVTDALGVDHIMLKPSQKFMNTMYRRSLSGDVHVKAAITRASNVCNSCINLINTSMIKLALRHRAPLIAGGYLGGQVPKDGVTMTLSLARTAQQRVGALARYQAAFGVEAERYFALEPHVAGDVELTVVNPLLAKDYDVAAIIRAIKAYGWEPPSDTGAHSSNCRLNDLGILGHIKRYGFHPYEWELAELVRAGRMDRDAAIAKLEDLPDPAALLDVFEKLGLGPEAL